MTKKTIFIFFCVLVVIAIGIFFYYEENIFSKQFLQLEVTGQDSAVAGEEITYTVKYKNNSNFVLKDLKIVFQLPDNSLTEDGKMRLSQSLADISPGQDNSVTFKTRLLGKLDDTKTARAWLSYVPENLSARYELESMFVTKINAVPVDLNFDLPTRAQKGKEFTYTINYLSNIDYPLENLSIKVEAPSGFSFISSIPNSLDHSEWKLQTLNKSKEDVIKIRGLVLAEPNEILHFSAKLGMWQDGSFIVIKEVEQNVEVTVPLLLISQKINGSFDYSPTLGETLNYQIIFKNNGSDAFSNVSIKSKISGQAFDLATLLSNTGQIKISDGSVIFDSQKNPELANFLPQEETMVEFSVKLKDTLAISDAIVIKNKVSAGDFSQEFSGQVSAK